MFFSRPAIFAVTNTPHGHVCPVTSCHSADRPRTERSVGAAVRVARHRRHRCHQPPTWLPRTVRTSTHARMHAASCAACTQAPATRKPSRRFASVRPLAPSAPCSPSRCPPRTRSAPDGTASARVCHAPLRDDVISYEGKSPSACVPRGRGAGTIAFELRWRGTLD